MPPAEKQKYPPVNVNLKFLTPNEVRALIVDAGVSSDDIAFPMGSEDPGKALAGLAWMVTKRDYPDVTLEEAGDIPIDLTEVPVDPTTASS